MRLAAACIMVAATICATVELGAARWRAGDIETSVPAGPVEDEPLAEGTTSSLSEVAIPRSMPAAYADGAGQTRTHGSCQDLSASFLNPTCRFDKPHAKHAARIPHRVATVTAGAGGGTDKLAALTAQTVARPAPLPQKPKAAPGTPIVLHPPARASGSGDLGVSAYAAAPRLGRDDPEPPDGPSRAAALAPSRGEPFGMFSGDPNQNRS